MPRAKKRPADGETKPDEPVQLRRSSRKRKAVDYNENKKVIVESGPEPELVSRKKAKLDGSKDGKNGKGVKKTDAAVNPKPTKSKKVETAMAAGVPGAATMPDGSEAAVRRPPPEAPVQVKKKAKKAREGGGLERRKRPFQAEPPENFEKKKTRALSQPIAVLDRERYDSEGVPQEKFTMQGSGSSQYEVQIKLVPHCSCADFVFRRQSCKHIIYVLHYALKVPEDSELLYQLAFTFSELKQILSEETAAPSAAPEDLYKDGKRKLIEGECPVCYMEFDPNKESIVYCKAACGNNIHDKCMKTWIQAQTSSYRKATCPLCRNDWVQ